MSRAEVLARTLEQQIVDEAFPAGTRLGTKREIKERHRVALGTLNEAVRLLEMRSLVELRPGPGGGIFVTEPSAEVRLSHLVLGFKGGSASAEDCLAVRNTLEYLVVGDAATFRTSKDLRECRKILARMEAEAEDPASYLAANWALHRRLVEISPNMLLRNLYTTLLDNVESQLRDVDIDDAFDASENIEVHRALIEAVASQDSQQVRAAVDRHAPSTARLR